MIEHGFITLTRINSTENHDGSYSVLNSWEMYIRVSDIVAICSSPLRPSFTDIWAREVGHELVAESPATIWRRIVLEQKARSKNDTRQKV